MNIPDEIDELAALYAAGALTAEQRHEFEEFVAGDPKAAAALKLYEPVLLALVSAIPPVAPDPRVRAALLQEIQKPVTSETAVPGSVVIRRAFDARWEETGVPGVRRRMLVVDRQRKQMTLLLRMDAGASYPSHHHDGPEESFILEGDLQVGDQVLREGDYQFAPAGSQHGVQRSENGCVALIIAPLREALVH